MMNTAPPVFPELIRTKLHPPPVASSLMRPRLVERLDDSLHVPLTLVCAPAGFGKTTLLCTWLDHHHNHERGEAIRTAWYAIDEGDNDLQVFLRYVVTAISEVYPGTCRATIELLRAPVQPHAHLLISAFINDLESLPGPIVLILDDYHSVDSELIHDLLREIGRHWPSPLHLILTSRRDPPLPIARMRAQNRVRDLRTRDLRLSAEEAKAYLASNLNIALSEKSLKRLYEWTEGWIAGLHLAVLSLAAASDPESAAEQLAGTDTYIAQYLTDEVLDQQQAETRDFLLATSVLERFSPELAQAVMGDQIPAQDINRTIEYLERANLFVIPLDHTNTWYRYHSLFRQVLNYRLQVEQPDAMIRAFHRRAAAWLGSRGYTDEALHHALAARDLELAADIAEAGLCAALNREDRATLVRWLEWLPAELVAARPQLSIIKAWALQFSWQLTAQGEVLRHVEQLLAATPNPGADSAYIREQLGVLNGQAAYLAGRAEEAIALCMESIANLPHDWRYVRGGAAIYLGLAMQACGRSAEAEQRLTQLQAESSDNADGFSLRILISHCFIHFLNRDTDRLHQMARLLIERTSDTRLATLSNWGQYFLGVVHYAQNQLEAAAEHFIEAINHRFSAQALTGRASFVGLALTRLAQGNSSEAFAVLTQLSEYDLATLSAETSETRSLRARLQIATGQTANASHWADSFVAPPASQPLLWLDEPRLTWAEILIALRKPGDVEAALEYLDELLEQARQTNNCFVQVRILVMRGQALSALTPPRTREALQELRSAIELAEPGNLIQPFLEAGRPIAKLLEQLTEEDGDTGFIARIAAEGSMRFTGPERSSPPPGNARPVEPLTVRENAVLSLMQQRLTDKEIAQELNISVQTAKRHAANIYVKLGVSRRWDAVTLAESQGLLTPSSVP